MSQIVLYLFYITLWYSHFALMESLQLVRIWDYGPMGWPLDPQKFHTISIRHGSIPVKCTLKHITRRSEFTFSITGHMMTSSNGNIFRVTGHLCGKFNGPRWISRTKASDAELWFFFDLRLNKRLSKQPRGWWFETLSSPLWRHRNVCDSKWKISPGWWFNFMLLINSSPHVPHICASVNWASIGPGNGLSPVRRQAITWTNTDLLSIGPLGTNYRGIGFRIQNCSFMKMHMKTSSSKLRPFCPGGDE